jgi:RNA polymerase sigma factor (sigma-70 family)
LPEHFDIQALKEGSEEAFRELVESFKDRVYNTCLGFMESKEEAEDVAQEVFMEIFSSIRSFREESQLSTWVYRIAVTKSLEAIRRKRRKKRFAIIERITGTDEPVQSYGDAGEYHPLAQIEHRERANALYAAIEELPDSQRVAFTLHKVEGLSQKEVSEVMDTSIPAVESLIHRAKENLRKRLFVYYQGDV